MTLHSLPAVEGTSAAVCVCSPCTICSLSTLNPARLQSVALAVLNRLKFSQMPPSLWQQLVSVSNFAVRVCAEGLCCTPLVCHVCLPYLACTLEGCAWVMTCAR